MALALQSLRRVARLGATFASLYVGSSRVATAPDAPDVSAEWVDANLRVFSTHPQDGGQSISAYRIYVSAEVFDTVSAPEESPFMIEITSIESLVGQPLRLSAINAVGEGLLSAETVIAEV